VFVRAIFAGIIGSILQTVFSYLLFLLGIAKTHYLLIAGEFFLNSKALHTFAGYIVGFVADITAGGFFALVFVYFLSITGKDYWILKAIGYTGFVWVVGIGLLDRALKIAPVLHQDAVTNLALLGSDLVYSFTMAYLVVKWGTLPTKILKS